MRRVSALWIAPTAVVLCGGCGLLLDLGGDEDPELLPDGAVLADGRVVTGDAAGGSRDGSVSRMDGAAILDGGGAGDDAGATDAGGSDGGAPRIDAGPCVDDGREEDDDVAQAMDHGLVSDVRPGLVTLPPMTSCPGDDDLVYAYSDCCEDTRGAVLMYDSSDGRLELTAVDIDAGGGATPWSRPGTETMPGRIELLTRGSGGYFVVEVRNASGTPVPYTLTVYAPVYVSL